MAPGLLCLIWDEADCVSLRREPSSFLRDYPSGFECDLRLRLPRKLTESTEPSLAPPGTGSQTVPIFLCRHVSRCAPSGSPPMLPAIGAPDVPRPPPHPIALVKSSMQKAVRRGLATEAVAAAAYLIAHDPKDLLRRLPVVLVEDVGVFTDHLRLVWLMVAVQSGYGMCADDLRFVLSLVRHVALHRERAPIPRSETSDAETESAVCSALLLPQVNQHSRCIAGNPQAEGARQAMVIRACYGGMACDVKMLLAFSTKPELWQSKIAPSVPDVSKDLPADICKWLAVLDGTGSRVGPCWGCALPADLRLLEGVDFHCSDIVPHVFGQLRSRGMVNLSNPGAVPSDAALKEAIWHYRSSTNCRDPISQMPPPLWWNSDVLSLLTDFSRAAWSPKPTGSVATPAQVAQNSDRAAKRVKTQGPRTSQPRQLSILRFAGGA